MPLFKFRAVERAKSCRTCRRGYKELVAYEDRHTACKECGHPVRIAIQAVPHKVSRKLKGADGTGSDYRSDLARYPGDPRARVDGPAAVEKLIEQTKREGAEVSTQPPTLTQPKTKTGEEILGEAYLAAKEKGFRLDSEGDA